MLNRIYTIGHSTRTLDELVALLREHGVTLLADIRRFPGSRRHPHFSRDSLEQSLPPLGVAYEHFESLGGRRKPVKNSPNAAWESDQFRGYADHMATDEFQNAVDRLLDPPTTDNPSTPLRAGRQPPTAIMCAEAVPWRCHRNLLSDELVRRGVEVIHILGRGSAEAHVLSEMARIEGGRVIYPPVQKKMFP
jgi:uncharacterized protein (DUF488 family)